MNEAVEAEINQMEKDGILKSAPYFEWTSQRVIVPKLDGTIIYCTN